MTSSGAIRDCTCGVYALRVHPRVSGRHDRSGSLCETAPVSVQPRVVVIGCGYWGQNLIRNFAELGALVGVTDIDEAAAVATADRYGVDAYAVEDAIETPAAPALVVA